jgi:NADPH2:quinone reductase
LLQSIEKVKRQSKILIMKETVVFDGPRAEIIESSIPKAEFNKVVIKVEVSGTNPKDWKTWWAPQLPINMGDDFAGTIHEVGPGVSGFRVCI